MDSTQFPPYCQDDDLVASVQNDGLTRVSIYCPTSICVVLGTGSSPETELHIDACQADGVDIFRRRGGGCAVVLDPGNVIVSVAAVGLPFGQHRQQFNILTNWLIAGLEHIGYPGIVPEGICDLALNDRKVGGACLYRSRDLLYYSISLLVNPDLNLAMRYLRHPPREPEYRRGRVHDDFMGSINAARYNENSEKESMMPSSEQVAGNLRDTLEPPVFSQPDHSSGVCIHG